MAGKQRSSVESASSGGQPLLSESTPVHNEARRDFHSPSEVYGKYEVNTYQYYTSQLLQDSQLPIEESVESSLQPPKDPTSPLTRVSVLEHDATDLFNWIKMLNEDRFLILQCCDSEVLVDAGYAIAQRLESQRKIIDCRVLRFGNEEEEGLGSHFNMLCDDTLESKSPSFVMVMANVSHSRAFVRSMPSEDPTAVHDFIHRIGVIDRYILILGNQESSPLSSIYDDYRKEVKFLLPRLKKHYPKSSNSFHKKLLRQIKHGYWPDDPYDFFQQISPTFRDGDLGLEMDRRQKGLPDKAAQEAAQIEAKALLSQQDEMEVTVLFVATFLPGISALDFDHAVLTLLGDREVETNASTWISGEDEKRLLSEVWGEKHREIMNSCHLDFRQPIRLMLAIEGSLEYKAPVADFTNRHLRKALKGAFWTSSYKAYVDLLGRVFGEGLFFEKYRDEMVMEGVIRLIVDTAKIYLELHGQEWLLNLVLVSAQCDSSKKPCGSAGVREAIENIGEDIFYYRMKNLILEMIAHENLRGLIDAFLAKLVDLHAIYAIRNILLRLLSADQIDVFYWWRVILDGNPAEEDKAAVIKDIKESALRGDAQLFKALWRLGHWLPRVGHVRGQNSEHIAPGLITSLCLEKIFAKKRSAVAICPPSNPILRALALGDYKPLQDTLIFSLSRPLQIDSCSWRSYATMFLSNHLLTDDVKEIWPSEEVPKAHLWVDQWAAAHMHEEDSAFTPGSYFPQALVLGDWILEIRSSENEVPESAMALFEGIIDAIHSTFDRKGRSDLNKELVIFTQLQKEFLLELIGKADQLLSQANVRAFQQVQNWLLREIAILRDFANRVSPFAEQTVVKLDESHEASYAQGFRLDQGQRAKDSDFPKPADVNSDCFSHVNASSVAREPEQDAEWNNVLNCKGGRKKHHQTVEGKESGGSSREEEPAVTPAHFAEPESEFELPSDQEMPIASVQEDQANKLNQSSKGNDSSNQNTVPEIESGLNGTQVHYDSCDQQKSLSAQMVLKNCAAKDRSWETMATFYKLKRTTIRTLLYSAAASFTVLMGVSYLASWRNSKFEE